MPLPSLRRGASACLKGLCATFSFFGIAHAIGIRNAGGDGPLEDLSFLWESHREASWSPSPARRGGNTLVRCVTWSALRSLSLFFLAYSLSESRKRGREGLVGGEGERRSSKGLYIAMPLILSRAMLPTFFFFPRCVCYHPLLKRTKGILLTRRVPAADGLSLRVGALESRWGRGTGLNTGWGGRDCKIQSCPMRVDICRSRWRHGY